MYNKEIKMEFISAYTNNENTIRNCVTFFNAISKYEEEIGADICTLQEKDLIPILEATTGIRSFSKTRRIIILKKYFQWCKETNRVKNAGNGMDNITKIMGLGKYKTHMVSSPIHLQAYLNIAFAAESANTVDNTFRCFYWLAYGGMDEEDICKVTTADVDMENMYIKYNSTFIPIYREAVQAFIHCIKYDAFSYEHANYTKDRTIIPRADGNLLLRGFKQPNVLSFRQSLSRRSKKIRESEKTDLELSYYRVWLSGLFYRIYEQEKMGIEPDFLSVISQLSEKDKDIKLSKFNQLAKEYKEDYQRWKLVFDT
jgi:hypothetical protein